MKISIIAAMDQDRCIGKDGRLPWRQSADLKQFKRLTKGRPIIMGRKTWESLPGKLPGRIHIVITGQEYYDTPGVNVVHSPEQAIERAKELTDSEAFVIGGSSIYEAFLPLADKVYLTLVEAHGCGGDTFFPKVPIRAYALSNYEYHEAGEGDDFDYAFAEFTRSAYGDKLHVPGPCNEISPYGRFSTADSAREMVYGIGPIQKEVMRQQHAAGMESGREANDMMGLCPDCGSKPCREGCPSAELEQVRERFHRDLEAMGKAMRDKFERRRFKRQPDTNPDGQGRRHEHMPLLWFAGQIQKEFFELMDALNDGDYHNAMEECADIANNCTFLFGKLNRETNKT